MSFFPYFVCALLGVKFLCEVGLPKAIEFLCRAPMQNNFFFDAVIMMKHGMAARHEQIRPQMLNPMKDCVLCANAHCKQNPPLKRAIDRPMG